MKEYEKGKTSRLMTLNWKTVTWQISSVGILFSNVIGTLALLVVPILAVVFFHDKLYGAKVIALLAIWGFLLYIYQHYLDDSKFKVN
jgi:energy-coupling factor transporter transmembrane protein EcfT